MLKTSLDIYKKAWPYRSGAFVNIVKWYSWVDGFWPVEFSNGTLLASH